MQTRIHRDGYTFIVLNHETGKEVFGALFKDHERLSEFGWWRSRDPETAAKIAIDTYELVQEMKKGGVA